MDTCAIATKSIVDSSISSLHVPTPSVPLIRRPGLCLSVLAAAALAACGVHYGFSEGAFPPHIHTMAVLPFENQTSTSELQSELLETMRHDLQRRLGVRDAPEERADALVRGTIVSYDVDVPVAFSAEYPGGNVAVSAALLSAGKKKRKRLRVSRSANCEYITRA